MGLLDLFKRKKETSQQATIYKRHWLNQISTIALPQDWLVSYIDRFEAQPPDQKATLSIITYQDGENATIDQAFFENLKLDFYQEYEKENFISIDKAFVSDSFIGKTFSNEEEVQYHLTTAKKVNGTVAVTEFLLRSQSKFSEEMRDFLHKVGQSLAYIEEFSQLFIERMKTNNPKVEIISAEGMEIKWKIQGIDKQEVIFLDNMYAEYMHRPDELDNILDKYADALFNIQAKIQLDTILPIVKNVLFIEYLKENEPEKSVYYETINSELVVLYYTNVEDNPMYYLSKEDVARLRISEEALKNASLENLSQKVEVTLQEEGSRYQVIADKNLESSFLLINDIWNKDNFPVKGNLVIAIPTRDILYVVDSLNPLDIIFAKQKITENFVEGNYVISDKLFEFRDGELIVFEG